MLRITIYQMYIEMRDTYEHIKMLESTNKEFIIHYEGKNLFGINTYVYKIIVDGFIFVL